MPRAVQLLQIALALVVAVGSLAVGDESQQPAPKSESSKSESSKSAAPAGKEKGRPGRELPGFTSEREAAALTFIGLHHPEMAELLRQLKGSSPAEYKREIRVLFRSSENLAELQEKDPEQYVLELKAWILDSRIRLLAARLSMAPSEALEQELRQALSDQIDVRIAQQTLTRDRMQARIKDMNSQIERLEATREEQIQRRIKSLVSGKGPRPKAAKNRPATSSAKPRSEADTNAAAEQVTN